jgi:hypothetical protein
MCVGEVHVRAPATVPELCVQPWLQGPRLDRRPGLRVQVLPQLGPLHTSPSRTRGGTPSLYRIYPPGIL